MKWIKDKIRELWLLYRLIKSANKQLHERETLNVKKVSHCARCGNDHSDIEFKRFSVPITDLGTNVEWWYWATCPITGDPILLNGYLEV